MLEVRARISTESSQAGEVPEMRRTIPVRGEKEMKYTVLFIALALCVLAAMPASASTVQFADGTMNKVSGSVQVSGNFAMGSKNVYQESAATMQKSRESIQISANINVNGKNTEQFSKADMTKSCKSIQAAGNVNVGGKNVQQQATASMKRAFKSVQVVPNVNIS